MHGEDEHPEILIVGIAGSLRTTSYTRMAVDLALAGAQEAGAKTMAIDLRNFDLVLSNGNEDESHYPEGVFRLREDVKKADGIILGTPEYHGGYSGVLKNAIDLMGFKQFESKVLGLVGVGGGTLGAVNALNGLRVVGRSLHAWVIPEQASVPQAWEKFDPDGSVSDKETENRLKTVGRQVARFSYLHSSEKAREFMNAWENAQPNPGG
jgi:NAD(P)H-dependent FMN reductase